jgi:hypothetical protein
MTEHMIFRVSRLTCGRCGETQRVKILMAGDTEVMPACAGCGPTDWLALPKLTEPPSGPRLYVDDGTQWVDTGPATGTITYWNDIVGGFDPDGRQLGP